jgi:hypothetical protein
VRELAGLYLSRESQRGVAGLAHLAAAPTPAVARRGSGRGSRPGGDGATRPGGDGETRPGCAWIRSSRESTHQAMAAAS